jgi:predicted RND superfamily exporter protein
MTRIRINNNQLAWFKADSEIRRADALMNDSLGGSGHAYIVVEAEREGPLKSPAALRDIEQLQRELERLPAVGKTYSVVDYLRRMNRVVHGDDPRFEAVPATEALVAQYLFLLGTSGRPADVDNVLDPTATSANIAVQLRTWDVSAMRDVVATAQRVERALGGELRFEPAGIAHLNLVWNDDVLSDVLLGFVVALLAVFVVLGFNFRSIRCAAVSYVPLLVTIVLIYGVLGFAGKDFDMPICVLSTLSLGMAVDFAIHFIARFRQALAERRAREGQDGGVTLVKETLLWTASRPGRGILRNAVLFAGTFSVMMFASLTPYITVGAFMVSMMVLSATLTLLVVPAVIMLLGRSLVR